MKKYSGAIRERRSLNILARKGALIRGGALSSKYDYIFFLCYAILTATLLKLNLVGLEQRYFSVIINILENNYFQ